MQLDAILEPLNGWRWPSLDQTLQLNIVVDRLGNFRTRHRDLRWESDVQCGCGLGRFESLNVEGVAFVETAIFLRDVRDR